jgi:DNA-binding NtrC family response regulator
MGDKEKLSAIERLRQRKSARQAQVGDQGPTHTIFVVDDEAPNLDALARVLNDRYKVTRFESATKALEVIAGGSCPDLIITDQRMPGMTGVEFLAAVGEIYPQSIGVVLSGFTERNDLVGAVNTGRVFAYVTKPWQPETLLDTITSALEHSNKRQEQAAITDELKDLGSQFDDLAELLGEDSGELDDLSSRLDKMTASLELLDS